MNTIKGPAIFLAQFVDDQQPYNTLDGLCKWASNLGYKGIQIPTWDARLIDLIKASESKTYADEVVGLVGSHGLQITELSTHLQGQLVAVHASYDTLFDGFAPEQVRGNSSARTIWAVKQLIHAARASQNMNLNAHASFSGSLLWPYVYPWPQRPNGLVKQGFSELAQRWIPILNRFDECGVNLCYELHPGEDLHDGITFERFLDATNNHPRACILYDPSHFVLQAMDYLQFIDFYYERIKAFHVKDAEFLPSGKQGVYGGYTSWAERAGRFRSLGDGMIDFNKIFSKLTQYNFEGWAVLEWECALKDGHVGAKEGVELIQRYIIEVTKKSFDNFADAGLSSQQLSKLLGI